MPIDYSHWDHIEVSDDEDDVHPNIDKASLWKWKKEARVEREKKEAEERKKLHNVIEENKKKLESFQNNEKYSEKEIEELRRQTEEFERKEAEIELMEKLHPHWTSSNICKSGFDKSGLQKPGTKTKEEKPFIPPPDENLEKPELQNEFFEKHRDELQTLGLLTSEKETMDYFVNHRHLFHDYSSNYLVVWGIDFAVDVRVYERRKELEGKIDIPSEEIVKKSKHNMTLIANKCLYIRYMGEIRKIADRGDIISHFFTKLIATPDPKDERRQALQDDCEKLVEKMLERADARIDSSLEEAVNDAKKKRIEESGGTLDPMEVIESLPEKLRLAFETRDLEALQVALMELSPEDAKYHMKRCELSGLWNPATPIDDI